MEMFFLHIYILLHNWHYLHIYYAAANILLSENGDVKVYCTLKEFIIPICVFHMT